MRTLVIGGTKFIGPVTVAELVRAGHTVGLYNRGKTPADVPERVVGFQGDRLDSKALASTFSEFRPEVVLDLCSFFEAHQTAFEQAAGTLEFKHVLVSSCDVYRNYGGLIGQVDGDPDKVPLSEDAPLRTRLYPYRGESWAKDGFDDYDKIPIEERVLERGGAVARLPMVYGPGDHQHRVHQYLSRIDACRPAIVLGEREAHWTTCRSHVINVAHALRLVVESGVPGQVYNVAEEPVLNEMDWVRSIGAAAAWRGEVVTVPDDKLAARAIDRPEWHLSIDTSKIRNSLGFKEIVSFESGMADTIDWERKNPHPSFVPQDFSVEDEILAALA